MIKAVILCGGQGTRIRDVSEVLPKPMLPLGNRPLLWHIMKIYSYYGIKDFILCLGFKGWVIKEFFINFSAKTTDITLKLNQPNKLTYQHAKEKLDWQVTLAETGEASETGARLWRVRQYLKNEPLFCLTYGDGVANINLKALLAAHKRSGLLATVTAVHPVGRFGEINTRGRLVTEFNEKPNVSQGLINGGFMVFSREALNKKFFRSGEDLNLELEVLPKIVKAKKLGVYRHKGFWQCVDTRREYDRLNRLWKNKKAPWKIWD